MWDFSECVIVIVIVQLVCRTGRGLSFVCGTHPRARDPRQGWCVGTCCSLIPSVLCGRVVAFGRSSLCGRLHVRDHVGLSSMAVHSSQPCPPQALCPTEASHIDSIHVSLVDRGKHANVEQLWSASKRPFFGRRGGENFLPHSFSAWGTNVPKQFFEVSEETQLCLERDH